MFDAFDSDAGFSFVLDVVVDADDVALLVPLFADVDAINTEFAPEVGRGVRDVTPADCALPQYTAPITAAIVPKVRIVLRLPFVLSCCIVIFFPRFIYLFLYLVNASACRVVIFA